MKSLSEHFDKNHENSEEEEEWKPETKSKRKTQVHKQETKYTAPKITQPPATNLKPSNQTTKTSTRGIKLTNEKEPTKTKTLASLQQKLQLSMTATKVAPKEHKSQTVQPAKNNQNAKPSVPQTRSVVKPSKSVPKSQQRSLAAKLIETNPMVTITKQTLKKNDDVIKQTKVNLVEEDDEDVVMVNDSEEEEGEINEEKQAKVVRPPVVVRPRFVGDERVRRVRNVGGALVPHVEQKLDPFLSSFLGFVTSGQACAAPKSGLQEVLESITYIRPKVRLVRRKREEEAEDEEEEEDPEDPLTMHIKEKGLPLVRRRSTLADGNCWYDSVADQVKLCLAVCQLVPHCLFLS